MFFFKFRIQNPKQQFAVAGNPVLYPGGGAEENDPGHASHHCGRRCHVCADGGVPPGNSQGNKR